MSSRTNDSTPDISASAQEAGNKALIRSSAFALLMEKGYSKTSYTDIAERSGLKRALVQYYFPKKDEFITSFIDELLGCVDEYARKKKLTTDSCFVDFSITGFLYFNFLLNNESIRPLALDLIANRTTSTLTLERMASWQHRYSELANIDDAVITDAILLSAGGAHELIYHHLENGIEIDIHLLLQRVISAYITLLGLSPEEFERELQNHRLDEATVKKANKEIMRAMQAL